MRRGELEQTRRNPWRLTQGEMRVVRLLCQGLSSPEICQEMTVSPRTLQSHLCRIFQKVGVFDRVGLVVEVLHQPLAREFCFPDLLVSDRLSVGTELTHRGFAPSGTDGADRTDRHD